MRKGIQRFEAWAEEDLGKGASATHAWSRKAKPKMLASDIVKGRFWAVDPDEKLQARRLRWQEYWCRRQDERDAFALELEETRRLGVIEAGTAEQLTGRALRRALETFPLGRAPLSTAGTPGT